MGLWPLRWSCEVYWLILKFKWATENYHWFLPFSHKYDHCIRDLRLLKLALIGLSVEKCAQYDWNNKSFRTKIFPQELSFTCVWLYTCIKSWKICQMFSFDYSAGLIVTLFHLEPLLVESMKTCSHSESVTLATLWLKTFQKMQKSILEIQHKNLNCTLEKMG